MGGKRTKEKRPAKQTQVLLADNFAEDWIKGYVYLAKGEKMRRCKTRWQGACEEEGCFKLGGKCSSSMV